MEETKDNKDPNVDKESYDDLKERFEKILGVIISKFGQNDQRIGIFVIVVVFLLFILILYIISFILNITTIF